MDEAVKQALIQKSLRDEAFRQRVLADPKATMEQESGKNLPAEIEIRVLEETNDTIYLVLPATGAPGQLSDKDLDVVAGGFEPGEYGGDVKHGGHIFRNYS